MKKNRVRRLNSQGLIYLGAWPPAFVAAAPQWPLHQDDGALLHRPPLTPRPPRAPLLSCLQPAVFVGPAPWSLALRAPAAGTKSAPPATQGYRCARWRKTCCPIILLNQIATYLNRMPCSLNMRHKRTIRALILMCNKYHKNQHV